jgi:hypothetical protein
VCPISCVPGLIDTGFGKQVLRLAECVLSMFKWHRSVIPHVRTDAATGCLVKTGFIQLNGGSCNWYSRGSMQLTKIMIIKWGNKNDK